MKVRIAVEMEAEVESLVGAAKKCQEVRDAISELAVIRNWSEKAIGPA